MTGSRYPNRLLLPRCRGRSYRTDHPWICSSVPSFGYSHNGSVESLPVKSISLDYYLLSERHLINISFVYFRLDSPCGSIREAKQWARSDCTEGLSASRVNPQYSSVDRSKD